MAALFPNGRSLAVEAVVIAALIALAAFLVYHFTVHTIVNRRPLGAENVDVSPATFDQSQAAFAVDRADAKVLFGASNDSGLEVLRIYGSTDGGRTWSRSDGPPVPGGSCSHGAPAVALDATGREYLAFLAARFCGDTLTPYLVVTSRAGPRARWAKLVRVAPPTWKYGFDDAPSIAAAGGTVYLAWTRSLSKDAATVVVSESKDRGLTWSPPTPISASLDHPHRVRIAVASNGDLYATGIDAKTGLWIARSQDGGKTFTPPRSAGTLLANPAAGCGLTVNAPLPRDLSACEGPDPTLGVTGDRVYVVYGDAGADRTLDVYAATLTRALEPVSRVQVNPPDTDKTQQQFMPTAALDPTTGVISACWYDTTYDPHGRRAWFTCAASKNGRSWGDPVRAAAVPTSPTVLYGTLGGAGLVPGVAAEHGVVHPFWADGRINADSTDIFTASIPEQVLLTHRG